MRAAIAAAVEKCHRGTRVQMLWHSPGSLTGRNIWDRAGYKRVSRSLTACAYRKKGMTLLLRGIERYSVRLWRV